ncbi:MAG: Hydrogen cyanide synthase subunit HcnC [Chlamydiae bacterium]|nr:Hydrogen cyanide synthase subunit HcnC [Chlamydiota bacterium]
MRIAVLGAGFAGLATIWHLLNHSKGTVSIDLFEAAPIGSGASGISPGLLHPFPGKKARMPWQAEAGLNATHELFTVASNALNRSVILSKGVLRPTISKEQILHFKECAARNPDEAQWWDKEECLKTIPGLVLDLPDAGGLYIKRGLTINPILYLEGLWQACARLGCQWHRTAQVDTQKLQTYDCILFAVGHAVKQFKNLEEIPITPVKGQILELKWPEELPPLPFSLISTGYVVMGPDQKSCVVGTTHERDFKTIDPEPEVAAPLIFDKINRFFPQLAKAKIIRCRTGLRASAPKRLPIVGKIFDKMWFITGLGGKGLLYHAWVGDLLSQAMLANDPSNIPPELWYVPK